MNIKLLLLFIVALLGSEITYSIETIKGIFSKISVDNLYQVRFTSANYGNWLKGEDEKLTGKTRNEGFYMFEKVGLLCTDAELPATSYEATQVFGDRQGLTEMFPTRRIYPPLNLTFYVDSNHVVIKMFEMWMNFINPINSIKKMHNTYGRMRYPDTYKDNIEIIKFEKDAGLSKSFLTSGGNRTVGNTSELRYKSPMLRYHLTNCWPMNMSQMPVSYGTANILKVSVTFQYDRYYVFESNPEDGSVEYLFNEKNLLQELNK